MITEKPKRKSAHQKKSIVRAILIILILLPATLFVLHPVVGKSLLVDGIALSVMICAAVYLVTQAILHLIAAYLGIIYHNDDASEIISSE